MPDRRHPDVEEFFRAQVRAEARLGDDIIRQLHAQLCGDDAVAAVGDVGERPAVHQRGRVLQRLHQVRVKSVLQQRGHGARRADLFRRDGRARIRVAHSRCGPGGPFRSARSVARQKMAITSLATVMSKPSSRGCRWPCRPGRR